MCNQILGFLQLNDAQGGGGEDGSRLHFQIEAYSMIFIFLENGDNNDNKPKKFLI